MCCACICACTFIRVCAFAREYVRLRAYSGENKRLHTNACAGTRMREFACVCVCVCVCASMRSFVSVPACTRVRCHFDSIKIFSITTLCNRTHFEWFIFVGLRYYNYLGHYVQHYIRLKRNIEILVDSFLVAILATIIEEKLYHNSSYLTWLIILRILWCRIEH